MFYLVFVIFFCCCSVTKLFPTLQPHGLWHTMPPCLSLSPGVCSNSCSLSWWCHLTISFSLVPFSSCPQSFPASGSFPVSWLFASGGQSIGASATVLLMNIHSWIPLGLTGLISLQSLGTLRSLLQHHSAKVSILRCLAISMVHLSHLFMTTGKTITLTIWTFVSKVMFRLVTF